MPWAREVMDRYGPAIAVVAALALIVALGPAKPTERPTRVNAARSVSTLRPTADGTAHSGAANEAVGATGAVPEAQRVTGSTSPGVPANVGVPGTACRSDGAMPGFSEIAPPCAPVFRGNNGGATDVGVTATSVAIVHYYPPVNKATSVALTSAGVSMDPEDVKYLHHVLLRYYNLHTETYGREVKLIEFEGSGTDEQSTRADAIRIAQDVKPFLVMTNGEGTLGFAEELNARGIPCFCITSQGRGYYAKYPGLSFSLLPSLEQEYLAVADYAGARGLIGSSARFAGNPPPGEPNYNKLRRFGLVYMATSINGVPDPYADQAANFLESELARRGGRLETKIAYKFDVPQFQQEATNVIAQLRTAKVNNVIFVGDFLFPAVLTSEATRQSFFPEWFQTGSLLADWSAFGRTYDQQQWRHMFGVSAFPILPQDSKSYSRYQMYLHGGGDPSRKIHEYSTYKLEEVMNGVQLAGPNLTRAAFARGLFASKGRGGSGIVPRVGYSPMDPTFLFDFAEVWWDPNKSGTDELGHNGRGMMVRSNGYKRFGPSEWLISRPLVFGDDPAPVYEVKGSVPFDHDADGHKHAANERCRSCG